jgi:glutaredoxin
MVKQYLTSKGFAYEEVNLDETPERRADAIRLSGGLTVPVTHIERDNGQYVVTGWNLQKMGPMLAQ